LLSLTTPLIVRLNKVRAETIQFLFLEGRKIAFFVNFNYNKISVLIINISFPGRIGALHPSWSSMSLPFQATNRGQSISFRMFNSHSRWFSCDRLESQESTEFVTCTNGHDECFRYQPTTPPSTGTFRFSLKWWNSLKAFIGESKVMMLVVLFASLMEVFYKLKISSFTAKSPRKNVPLNNKSSVFIGLLGYTAKSSKFEASKRLSKLPQVRILNICFIYPLKHASKF